MDRRDVSENATDPARGGDPDRADEPGTAGRLSARLDRLPVLGPHIVWISILTVNLMPEYYDNALFAYIVPAIKANTGLTLGQIGMVGSAFFVGMLLGAVFGGRPVDRFGRRWVIVWGTVVYSLGALATALAPNFGLMLASRVVTGLGIQAASSGLLVYIAEMFPGRARGRFVSIVSSAFVLVAPLVAVLAFVMVPHGGPDTWRHLFAFGACGLLVAPMARFLMPESVRWSAIRGRIADGERIVAGLESRALRRGRGPLPEPEPVTVQAEQPTLRRLLADRRMIRTVAVVGLGYFGTTLGLYLFQNWALYVLVDGLKYSDGRAYWVQVTWNVVYFVTPFLALLVMDRVERKTLVFVCSAVAAVPLVGFGISADSFTVIATGGIAGILTGLVVTVFYAYIPEGIPTEARGLGSGVVKGFGELGGAVSGVLGATLYADWGRGGLMSVAAAAYVLFSVAVLLFGPRTTNRSLEGVAAAEFGRAD